MVRQMVTADGRIVGIDNFGDGVREKVKEATNPSFVLAGLVMSAIGGLLIYGSFGGWITFQPAVFGMVGIGVVAGGLWLVNQRVRVQLEKLDTKWRIALAGGLLIAGAVLMGLAVHDESPLLAAVAVVFLVAGLLAVGAVLGEPTHAAWPAGVAVGPPLVLLAPHLLSLGPALVAVLIGLSLSKRGVRSVCKGTVGQARLATRSGLGLVAIGGILLVQASRKSSGSLALVGGGLFLLGIIALSEAWPRLGLRPIQPFVLAIVGGVLFFVATYLMHQRLSLPGLALFTVAVVIFLVGASPVVRGEILLLVVLLGVLSVWVLIDRTDRTPLDPNPDPNPKGRILALGDSYISGEGSPSFFPGTNHKGENECRRSSNAYPYRVAVLLDMGLDFYSCSGATAAQVHDKPHQKGSPSGVVGKEPQLENPINPNTKLVLVSIGGNDALFGDVGKGCIFPGDCEALRQLWLTNLEQIGPAITESFVAIKDKLPKVPIVAVPYPLMVMPDTCGASLLHDAEHKFLSEFITQLDDLIRISAAHAGIHFFEGGLFAFDGQRICEHDKVGTAMNVVNVNPMEGSFVNRVSPANWTHGSLHPKPAGHQMMAEALASWLKGFLPSLDPNEPNPKAKPEVTLNLRNLDATPVLARPIPVPTPEECPGTQNVSPFASSSTIFDFNDKTRTPNKDLPPFGLDARPETVCMTTPGGSWVAAKAPDVTTVDGRVLVRPTRPDASRELPYQQFLYQDANDGWQLRIVHFCSREPKCPHGGDAFLARQGADAARELALPVMALFVSGWLVAIGLSKRERDEDLTGPYGGAAAAGIAGPGPPDNVGQ